MRLKTQASDWLHKPPDLAQRVRNLMAQTNDEQRESMLDATQSMSLLPSQDDPCLTTKPQVTSKTLPRTFNSLDIPFIDEDEDLT